MNDGKKEPLLQTNFTNQFELYPNPANRYLELDGDFTAIKTIKLLDFMGRTVGMYQPTDQIAIEGLVEGVYLLIIELKTGTNEHHKVYIQH